MKKKLQISIFKEKYPIVVGKNPSICVIIIIFQLSNMPFFKLNTWITFWTLLYNVF